MRALQRDGWEIVRTGDHVIFAHPTNAGHVPVPNHPSETVPPGTLRSILRLAGLEIEEFRALL